MRPLACQSANRNGWPIRTSIAPPRVFIGLKEQLVAEALGGLLRDAGFRVIGWSGKLEHLVARVRRSAPDLLLFGPAVDGPDGTSESLACVRAAMPHLRIVVLVPEVDPPLARALMRYSINGAIPLSARSGEAVATLRQVLEGRIVYPAAVLEQLSEPQELSVLSERQREVLRLLAAGRSNDEIADCLYISRNTVKFHLREIYMRLGVHNRVEAAGLARRTAA